MTCTHQDLAATGPPSRFNITGILRLGTYNGIEVNLRPYFDGGLISTNRGNKATSVNFLDGGDFFSIRENKAASSMSTNQ